MRQEFGGRTKAGSFRDRRDIVYKCGCDAIVDGLPARIFNTRSSPSIGLCDQDFEESRLP